MDDIILKKFYKFLMESVPGIVVKFSNRANSEETVDSKRSGDRYVSAMMGTDTLMAYEGIDYTILMSLGFTIQEAKAYSSDLLSIPKDKQKVVLKALREKCIAEYDEENDYYRVLNGLPPSTGSEVWFDDDDYYTEFGLEPMPIHEIPIRYLKAMEDRGYIAELIEMYPDEEYLKHLASRKISIVNARRAGDFDLLYFPNLTDSYSFYKNFINLYNECKDYFMTVIYNKFFAGKYDEYDNYIGFMILTLTINRMIISNFKVFVQRDFYDEFSTQTFLNAYGVPYSNRFSLSQMKLIAKNLNILLRVKETDIALLDIIDLLGYSDFTLSKYYLVRHHKLDENGNPEFFYTTNPDTGEKTLDLNQSYTYHFTRVPVTDKNVQEALKDVSNQLNYFSVTSEDPYWIEDRELQEKIRDTQFNYIETKYMDMSVVYKMHAILFETVYLSRIILDKDYETKKVMVTLAQLSPLELPVFDVIVFLICAVCKLYGIKPTLMNKPSKILHIAGFNFNADIEAIREDIKSHPNIYNQDILKYIDDVIFTNPDDINNFFVKIKNLEIKLSKLMNSASTIKSYKAYRKLYDTLLYIDLNNTIYALPDGTVPERFDEYLESFNPGLYQSLEALDDDDKLSTTIGYVTSRLMNIFTDADYLNYIQATDTSLLEAIVRLLSYFKSLTVDMRGVNVVVLFDSRVLNCAHVYNKFNIKDAHMFINEHELTSIFWEYVKDFSGYMTLYAERATNDEMGRALVDFYNRDNVFSDESLELSMNAIIPDTILTLDDINNNIAIMNNIIMRVSLEDKARIINEERVDYRLYFKDNFTNIISKDNINIIIEFLHKMDVIAIENFGLSMNYKEYQDFKLYCYTHCGPLLFKNKIIGTVNMELESNEVSLDEDYNTEATLTKTINYNINDATDTTGELTPKEFVSEEAIMRDIRQNNLIKHYVAQTRDTVRFIWDE